MFPREAFGEFWLHLQIGESAVHIFLHSLDRSVANICGVTPTHMPCAKDAAWVLLQKFVPDLLGDGRDLHGGRSRLPTARRYAGLGAGVNGERSRYVSP